MTTEIHSDDSFARMVAEEVKNKLSPLHKKFLMEPENWGRWKDALVALVDNLQDQLDSIDIDAESDRIRYEGMGRPGRRLALEAASAYASRRSKVERFLFHVDRRLDEVCAMIETGQALSSDGWQQVEFYKKAIATHRSLMREFDLEATAIDKALWATLDNKWTFDSIDVDSL